MKRTIKYIFDKIGYTIIDTQIYQKILDEKLTNEEDLVELFSLALNSSGLSKSSKAQLHQDFFVLLHHGFKTDGYFIEFGATDGIEKSNTYLLEKKYRWKGILAEPDPRWHESLHRNRTAIIDTSCVWKYSNQEMEFCATDDPELSTIKEFAGRDLHREKRKSNKTFFVKSISLSDLLAKHKAPENIDYLSIDTEGSEFEILRHFDFDKYNIAVITCEHNFNLERNNIFELLRSKGYRRILTHLSKYDDWYLK